MSFLRVLRAGAAWLPFLALACSGAGADDGDAADAIEDATSGRAHAAAVDVCKRERMRVLVASPKDDALLAAEEKYVSCLTRANDGAVEHVERKLAGVSASRAGSTTPSLRDYREATSAYCAESVSASPSREARASGLESAVCHGQRESFVAGSMDTFAALDDLSATALNEDREGNRACYEAFDASTTRTRGRSLQARLEPWRALEACVGERALGLASEMAQIEVERGAGREGLSVTRERLRDVVTNIRRTGASLCGVLAAAGGEGESATLATAACAVRVVEALAQQMTMDVRAHVRH